MEYNAKFGSYVYGNNLAQVQQTPIISYDNKPSSITDMSFGGRARTTGRKLTLSGVIDGTSLDNYMENRRQFLINHAHGRIQKLYLFTGKYLWARVTSQPTFMSDNKRHTAWECEMTAEDPYWYSDNAVASPSYSQNVDNTLVFQGDVEATPVITFNVSNVTIQSNALIRFVCSSLPSTWSFHPVFSGAYTLYMGKSPTNNLASNLSLGGRLFHATQGDYTKYLNGPVMPIPVGSQVIKASCINQNVLDSWSLSYIPRYYE